MASPLSPIIFKAVSALLPNHLGSEAKGPFHLTQTLPFKHSLKSLAQIACSLAPVKDQLRPFQSLLRMLITLSSKSSESYKSRYYLSSL